MADLDVTALSDALKEALPSMRLKYVGYQGNPFLAMVPKDTSFGGDTFRCPIWYGGNQGGVSSLFATAQANKSAGLYEKFDLTRVKKYGLTGIGTEALQASERDAYAFIKASVAEVDQTVRNVANDIGMGLYRNFGGARGRIAASGGGSGTTTLVLSNREDIVHFHKGMVIESDDTDGTAGGASDGEAITILSVDLVAGTITKSGGAWNTNGNFAASDYLFRSGDFGVCLSGLDSWVPSSNPGATSFFGVDRTTDVVRLGGLRHDGSTSTIEEALQDACILAGREGAESDVVFMNWRDFGDLRKSMSHRIEYTDVKASDEDVPITFKALVLPGVGKGGMLRIVPDRNCQQGVAWVLDMSTWVFATLGEAPKLLNAMGQSHVIWTYNADSIEVRTGFYGQLGCYAPGRNVRVALATAS